MLPVQCHVLIDKTRVGMTKRENPHFDNGLV